MTAIPAGETNDLAQRLANLPAGMIDLHTHAIDPDLADFNVEYEGVFPTVRRTGEETAQIRLGGRVYRDVDSRCWSAADRVRDMDADGVAVQVLSAIPVTLSHSEPAPGAAALARAQNDFLASMVSSAPRRLLALGCVPLQDPDLATTELERCVDELGFVGVEIGPRVGERELADPEFRPFFETAAALGAIVFLHPVDRTLDPRLDRLGIGFGLGMPTETAVAAAGLLVAGTFDAVPGLRICLAHAGGALPALLARLSVGQRLAHVEDVAKHATAQAAALWSDSLTYDVDNLLLAVTRFGAHHIVLGTDYPFAAKETPSGAVLGSDRVDATTRERIRRTNAIALFSGVGRPQPEGRTP